MKNRIKIRDRSRNHRCSKKKLDITVRYVHAPDFKTRVSRAIDMLLEGMTWEPTNKDGVKNEVKNASNGKLIKGKAKSKKRRGFTNIKGGET